MGKKNIAYQIFTGIFSLISLVNIAFLAMERSLSPELLEILQKLDSIFCLFFLFDFIYRFFSEKSKLKYLKWGWIDLLSSIPSVDGMRVLRITRVFRVLKVLKNFKTLQFLKETWSNERKEVTILTVLGGSIITVFLGAISILQFETTAGSNIGTAEEALWWSFVSITTVGYGDYYPVTTEGRAVASILMIYGIGLFGTLSGIFASYLTTSKSIEPTEEIQELRAEIQELKKILENTRDVA